MTAIDMRGTPVLKYLTTIPKMRKLLSQVDLVHGHFGFCGWLARCQFRKPLVISFMGDDLLGEPTNDGSLSWFSRQMVQANKFLATKADQVIVKSPEMARVIGHAPSHVVANGVDTEKFKPVDRDIARVQLGWNDEELVVLFPGNPDNPRKGFKLANAATEVAKELLQREIRIQPMWGIRPDEVPVYMNACNAMWMTSLIEGSPNVVKEALSCNRPIVGVPVGDVEYLLNAVEGCHFRPRDAQQLGEAMADLLSTYRESNGRDAIHRMALDLEAVADRVIGIYELALGSEITTASKSTQSSHTTSLNATGGR